MPLVIIPLAGPDFFSEQYGIRPLYRLDDGRCLIDAVLFNRPWVQSALKGNGSLIFVLKKFTMHTDFMIKYLSQRYPGSQAIVMDEFSMGAPFSAIAALSQIKDVYSSVVVDLADIFFATTMDVDRYFKAHKNVAALVPYFGSSSEKFSYLRLAGDTVLETKEKCVISSHASAGVYCFRSAIEFLRAFIFCLTDPEACKVNNNYFVCPTLNGLIKNGEIVKAFEVDSPNPIGALFH